MELPKSINFQYLFSDATAINSFLEMISTTGYSDIEFNKLKVSEETLKKIAVEVMVNHMETIHTQYTAMICAIIHKWCKHINVTQSLNEMDVDDYIEMELIKDVFALIQSNSNEIATFRNTLNVPLYETQSLVERILQSYPEIKQINTIRVNEINQKLDEIRTEWSNLIEKIETRSASLRDNYSNKIDQLTHYYRNSGNEYYLAQILKNQRVMDHSIQQQTDAFENQKKELMSRHRDQMEEIKLLINSAFQDLIKFTKADYHEELNTHYKNTQGLEIFIPNKHPRQLLSESMRLIRIKSSDILEEEEEKKKESTKLFIERTDNLKVLKENEYLKQILSKKEDELNFFETSIEYQKHKNAEYKETLSKREKEVESYKRENLVLKKSIENQREEKDKEIESKINEIILLKKETEEIKRDQIKKEKEIETYQKQIQIWEYNLEKTRKERDIVISQFEKLNELVELYELNHNNEIKSLKKENRSVRKENIAIKKENSSIKNEIEILSNEKFVLENAVECDGDKISELIEENEELREEIEKYLPKQKIEIISPSLESIKIENIDKLELQPKQKLHKFDSTQFTYTFISNEDQNPTPPLVSYDLSMSEKRSALVQSTKDVYNSKKFYSQNIINQFPLFTELNEMEQQYTFPLTRASQRSPATVQLFGSSINLPVTLKDCSDIDVSLICDYADSHKKEKVIMEAIKNGFNSIGYIISKIDVRLKLKVLKMYDPISKVYIDICLNNHIGPLNSKLISMYLDMDNRLPILILIIKYWAKMNDIGDASTHTLSSFSWTLMIIHYLQIKNILPSLHELGLKTDPKLRQTITINGITNYLPIQISMEKSNVSSSIESLLHGFFIYYSQFKFDEYEINIKAGTLTPRHKKQFKKPFIYINDPFIHTTCISKSVDEVGFPKILKAIILTESIIRTTSSLYDIIGPID
eukprot:gene5143-6403_t